MANRVLTTFRPVLPLLLIALLALAAPVAAGTDIWSTTGPFTTGAGDRVIYAFDLSTDGTILYCGTGSGSVWSYSQSFAVPAPVASFTGIPISGNRPLDLQFNDTSTNTPLAWKWSFGDGDWYNTTDASARNATHTYTAAGTYTVSLTAGNAGGSNTMTRAGYITVISVPGLPTAGFSGTPASGRVPLDVAFTDESDVFSGTMWNWSFGDGSWENSTVSVSPAHNYTSAGTYTAALTVTNASGSSTRTRAGYIAVSVPPTPTPTPAPVVTTTTATGGFSIGGGGSDSDSGGSPGTTGQQQGNPNQYSPPQGTPTTVNVGGSTPVTGATVYGTGNDGIVVTASERTASVAAVPLPPDITVYKYLEIKPAHATTITGAEITFTVPQSWLDEHHMTAQDIVMYHLVGASWVALPTTVVKAANGQVYFSATTPSFSLFAVSGKNNAAKPVQQNVQTLGDIAGNGPAGQAPVPDANAGPLPTPTAAPAPVPADPGFPLATVALIGAGCIVLTGSGWYVRRWYIRRQNPALFREYD